MDRSFWCRQCQCNVGVRAPEWRVNIVGKPNAGGECDRCGDQVLRRITRLDQAPRDIAVQAEAASLIYQHWRKVRTIERDHQLRTLANLFHRDRDLVEKLATGFGLHPKRVKLIIRDG